MPQGKESAEKIRDTQITEDFCHAQSHHPGVQVQKQALCCAVVLCVVCTVKTLRRHLYLKNKNYNN